MQNLSVKEEGQVREFYDCCAGIASAKFIIAEVKLGQILKTLAVSSELVNAVSESLKDFSFDLELNKAVVKNQMRTLGFRMPFESEKIVALAFSLLSEFESKRMDLHKFIFDHFDGENISVSMSFAKFVQAVVLPFRDELCAMVGFVPKTKENFSREQIMINEIEKADQFNNGEAGDCSCNDCAAGDDGEELDYVQTFFYELAVLLGEVIETINQDRRIKDDRRDEIQITVDAIMQACQLENLKILNALLISLNSLMRKVRSVKWLNSEVQNRVAEFYSFLP